MKWKASESYSMKTGKKREGTVNTCIIQGVAITLKINQSLTPIIVKTEIWSHDYPILLLWDQLSIFHLCPPPPIPPVPSRWCFRSAAALILHRGELEQPTETEGRVHSPPWVWRGHQLFWQYVCCWGYQRLGVSELLFCCCFIFSRLSIADMFHHETGFIFSLWLRHFQPQFYVPHD